MLVYSVVLVLIMIFRPQGIFGNWEFSLPKAINRIFYPKGKKGAKADTTETAEAKEAKHE